MRHRPLPQHPLKAFIHLLRVSYGLERLTLDPKLGQASGLEWLSNG